MANGTATVTLPSDEEILITREFDAPRHLVYRAWTTPELVRRWWASDMKTVEIDLRVGGTWRYVSGHDGSEVAFHGTYREIVPDERIVSTEIYEMPGAEAVSDADAPVNVITFTEVGDRTILELLTQCPSAELRDTILNSGMESGMQDLMDRLERVAASLR